LTFLLGTRNVVRGTHSDCIDFLIEAFPFRLSSV